MRYPAAEKLEIIRLVEHGGGGRWKSSALRGRPSTAGAITIRPVDRKPWTTDIPCRIASGTASRMMFASASSTWRWTSPRCQGGVAPQLPRDR